MNLLVKIRKLFSSYSVLLKKIEFIQEALGRIELRQLELQQKEENLRKYEFKVYSQSGEDGIIQYLVNSVAINNKVFVEFGVENYTESNTRFLALNNSWQGLVIDGDQKNIDYIQKDPIYWRRNIKAVQSFITKDNINNILSDNGFKGNIGLLSVDIDGNDYWVWDSISVVDADIVVCEYNSHFGSKRKVTVPYDPNFIRGNAHYSKIYYGASIAAFTDLAQQKGYALVGINGAGNNLFFVKRTKLGKIREVKIEEVFAYTSFRELHNEQGQLTYQGVADAMNVISDMDVYEIDSKKLIKIKELIQ